MNNNYKSHTLNIFIITAVACILIGDEFYDIIQTIDKTGADLTGSYSLNLFRNLFFNFLIVDCYILIAKTHDLIRNSLVFKNGTENTQMYQMQNHYQLQNYQQNSAMPIQNNQNYSPYGTVNANGVGNSGSWDNTQQGNQ